MNKLESVGAAQRLQHRVTRHAACDEVNKSMLFLEERHKEGKLSFIELQHEFTALSSRIMNLPQNQLQK